MTTILITHKPHDVSVRKSDQNTCTGKTAKIESQNTFVREIHEKSLPHVT